jgi:hypothetical protein
LAKRSVFGDCTRNARAVTAELNRRGGERRTEGAPASVTAGQENLDFLGALCETSSVLCVQSG